MRTPLRRLLLISLLALSTNALAQQQQPQGAQQNDEVLRISTELVQTDVAVFDKQGRFVDGLKLEDFEVRADGQPVQVSLFDRVVAGSSREEAQVQAARATNGSGTTVAPLPRGTLRGRSIIFFIDDLHLSASSVEKTRRAILQFIDNEMGPLDQVAIASSTGQVGFLQQFSDNKAVLRAALSRLNYRPYVIQDTDNIKMTEYNAVRISQGDKDTLDYFVTELLKATNFSSSGGGMGPPAGGPASSTQPTSAGRATAGISRMRAEGIVKNRAEMMLKQSVNVTQNTLATLESLMRSSRQLSGRKLVFFISDGFYLIDRKSGANDWVQRITDAAVRAGVVIYSLDARGLATSGVDATSNRADPMGRLSRADIGEMSASQDGMNALAEDTGGRALFNSDSFVEAMTRAVRETSNYYLLAWKPTLEEQKGGKFRKVDVSVKGRPELNVRLPRGYLEAEQKTASSTTAPYGISTASSKAEETKVIDADFREALTAFAPKAGVPTIVSTSYIDTPNNGTVITASVQVAAEALSYGADGKQPAAVDVAGVVLNDQGKPAASFKTRINVTPVSTDPAKAYSSNVIYNYKAPLKPGLYQVRVAARDSTSGRVGSSMQWIEIPDISQKRLALSSLLIGGQAIGASKTADAKASAPQAMQFSVDHRFSRSSHLGFWIFIYNAQRDAQGVPDVAAQVQVFRDNQSIVNTQPRKLSTVGMEDLARIPYAGDFALANLPPGRYILQITVQDRVAKSTASQRTAFEVQ